jgi:hypothetical protein
LKGLRWRPGRKYPDVRFGDGDEKTHEKPVASMSMKLLLLISAAPMLCPMGRIPTSVPRRKILRPVIIRRPPTGTAAEDPTYGATVG